MLTVLLCTVSVVAAVCAAIRMEAVWLSAAPPAARQRPETDAALRDAAAGGPSR